MNNHISSIKKLLVCLPVLVVFMVQMAAAQVTPLGSQYYLNRYLGNPAFAGLTNGFTGNLAYRSQFNKTDGSPVTQALTAEYGFNNRVGVGINAYNDKAGLLKRTRVMGTYAYHLPLSEKTQQLSFGLSIGINSERLNEQDVRGDVTDPLIAQLNNQPVHVDGDFGMAYTDGKLTLQGAIPNLRNFFKKDVINTADWSTFYTAISYKIDIGDELEPMSLEPLAALRGIKDHSSVLDIGANLAILNDQLYLSGLYHTSKNATFGFGINLKKYHSAVLLQYVTNTAGMSAYSNSIFQVGLRLKLSNDD
ncbi:PorP/SprF family type IX secretion system membrane protein [Mucilaginibacter celer]|uniref:Type IX secretion system membrane protein PorP/SprF n=1 Tax=Mucilaginibacter celer TaxID=2305508 RepID=A0A494VPF9_9SPHI|nr:PorP/SprF family type IX secretion system membrane protein [Mucilaginibacter celer]AYL95020.1 type IX secretion system membrane protein PorP/SprF [Mucilaginibacter celer]